MKCLKILFSVCLLNSFAFAGQEQYWNEGINSANSILNDTKSNMDTRINNPVANGTDLYTYDNSSHGKASLMCSQEGNIMQIGYSVNGGGDIDLMVNEDLDLNGKYETYFEMNGISGICANGVIKCDSGSWDNCKYYYITFNGSNLTYTKTDPKNLAGCYCINSSCGNIASNSKARVLSDIGGMLAQTIRNKYYIVSNVVVNGDYAYVRGKSINCNGESVPVGMDEGSLQAKTQEAKINGIEDNSSSYYVINQTAKNVNNNPVDNDFKNSLKDKQTKIKSTASWNEGANTYSYNDNGQNVSGSMFIQNPNQVLYCEIEYIENNPDVFADKTNRKNSTSSANVKKTKIIECVKNGNNWICPVKNGERIKHDCGKINDFGEVAGALSAIGEAAKDLTCSTN